MSSQSDLNLNPNGDNNIAENNTGGPSAERLN